MTDQADDPMTDVPTTEELDRTDSLLDQLASGTVDLSVNRSEPGQVAALTLLRHAADLGDATDSGTSPAFIAAVRHRAPEHRAETRRRWHLLAGKTLAVKVGIVATFAVLGVAAAGATGGLVRQVLPERVPTTTVTDTPERTPPAGGGLDSSSIASGAPPQLRLLDDETLQELLSACGSPDDGTSTLVDDLAERTGLPGAATCAAAAEEVAHRVAVADATATSAPRVDGRDRTDETGDPDGTGRDAPDSGNPSPRSNNPNAGAGNNPAGGNPNPNPNAGAGNNSAGGNPDTGRNPDAGPSNNPAGGNPNTGGAKRSNSSGTDD